MKMKNEHVSIIKYHMDNKEDGELWDFTGEYDDDWSNSDIQDDIQLSRFDDTKWLMSSENTRWLNSKQAFITVASLATIYNGYIVEIGSGPTGGFAPAYLINNPSAKVIISDISRTLMQRWHQILRNSQYQNATAMAFNLCDMPFVDESIDVISARNAIINIQGGTGDFIKALNESYRVLNIAGCLVIQEIVLTDESVRKLTENQLTILTNKYPSMFIRLIDTCKMIGFRNITEQVIGVWNNKDDQSDLAALCRQWGITLEFKEYLLFCKKQTINN